MKINELFKNNNATLSFEIFPPKKDTALKNIDETLEILSDLKPDFISITFGAGGSSNNNKTIELAKKIKNEYNIEPLVHLTCLNYTKKDIDKFIYELKESGINNILALRGDANNNELVNKDFFHASELTKYIKETSDFCLGGACYPEGHIEAINKKEDIINLKKKVKCGADFLITQLFFDNNFYYEFLDECKEEEINVPIIPGIMPVINKNQIEKMINLCGASLPNSFRRIINRFREDKEALFDAGISYALSQVVDLLASNVSGIHLYTMNNPIVAKKICDGIKSIRSVEYKVNQF